MKKNFNNKKYFEKQKSELFSTFNKEFERIYIEIGGKTIGDYHSSRVLSDYDPDIKYKIIRDTKETYEFIVCINAWSIIKKKKRKDTKKVYTEEIINLLDKFRKDGIKCNVAITRYIENFHVDAFISRLRDLGNDVYLFYEDMNYPDNVEAVISKKGLGMNDYIPCTSRIVYVIAPGTNSGKFAACISQIYNEKKLGIKSTYRKFETFLIPNLPINNPINLACSMAMCDVRGDDTIDYDYLIKHGDLICIDSRDEQSYKILKKVLPSEEKRTTIAEFFINNTYEGIIDVEVAEKHAKKEIIRRYKDYYKQYSNKKVSQIEFDEAERIYNLIQNDIVLTRKEMHSMLKSFIDLWGFDCQSNVCMEEMGELIQAICKYKREDYDEQYIPNILEEIADVHNMINQLEEYFGYERIRKIREQKIAKAQNYLKKEIQEGLIGGN